MVLKHYGERRILPCLTEQLIVSCYAVGSCKQNCNSVCIFSEAAFWVTFKYFNEPIVRGTLMRPVIAFKLFDMRLPVSDSFDALKRNPCY